MTDNEKQALIKYLERKINGRLILRSNNIDLINPIKEAIIILKKEINRYELIK